MSASERSSGGLSPEITTFLLVGGAGFIVDIVAFNLLRTAPWFATHDVSIDKIVAVALPMVVTYWGNRALTWRTADTSGRRREVALFVVFNVIGLGFSVVALQVSHHLLDLTSAAADNVSGNLIGIGLGTAFRFWAYRTFVFVNPDDKPLQTGTRDRVGVRNSHRAS